MKNTTLDLLDATLSKEHFSYINDNPTKRKRNLTEEFWLDNPNWEKYYNQIIASGNLLNWNEFKYTDVSIDNKTLTDIISSDETGIYMFIVRPENLIFEMPKYVLYIGIAGENNSERSLKKRLEDYFNINKIKKRDAVLLLLQKYYKNVYISYCLLNIGTKELKELESNLIGYFYPIANKDDFPFELKPIKKSF